MGSVKPSLNTDTVAAIRDGLQFIAQEQQPDGSFTSFSSPNKQVFKVAHTYQTTFVPALVLTSLQAADDPLAQAVSKPLAEFLLKQRSSEWSFNYWAKGSPQRKSLPYPDDLDDTFCSLAALQRYDETLLTGEVLQKVVQLLLAAERQVGGPYRTWLVSASSPLAWQDVDTAVNANIAYFLGMIGEPLPTLETYLQHQLEQPQLSSPYYPSDVPLLYYLSRGLQDPRRLHSRLSRKPIAQLNALETALLLSSYLQAQLSRPAKIDALARRLKRFQKSDGSWPASAFCIDPMKHGRTYYHGAAVLTTSFAVEALSLYQRYRHTAERSTVQASSSEDLQRQIATAATNQTSHLEPVLARSLKRSLQAIAMSSNGQEIIGLPFLCARGFRDYQKLAPKDLQYLALANLFGWLAYTIYDDFIDEEGKPALMSVANVSMRSSLQAFLQAVPEAAFQDYVTQTFDIIDGANAWEVAHCRFVVEGSKLTIKQLPNYRSRQKLAERSLGHTLTPLALLILQGISFDSAEYQSLDRALRHYLIARQLNDDAHDWQEDLRRGHSSYVVTQVLKQNHLLTGTHDLREIMPQLQQQFWSITLVDTCKTMRRHVRASRRSLNHVTSLAAGNIISTLLDSMERSITDTLAAQQKAQDFLEAYRN